MITLILGGARSGKSSFAEKLAYKRGKEKVTYIATSQPSDEEMKERIKQHKTDRPSTWKTIEEPYQVGEVISSLSSNHVILLDCITILISNLILKRGEKDNQVGKDGINNIDYQNKEEKVLEEMQKIIKFAADKNLIMVSNEVGLGLVPEYKLGRNYRDIAGRVNQYLARNSDEVYFSVAGMQVDIKNLAVDI